MITLADPLEHARACTGQRVAVIDGERSITWAELADRCARLAGALRASGLDDGDRVALLAANGHRYIEAFFGVPAGGLVLVPLNTRLAAAELAHIVRHSGARMLITDRDPGELAGHVEKVIELPDEYDALLDGANVASLGAGIGSNDVATLFYTGGTTGLPKGVMLTHGNLLANGYHKSIACSLGPDDIFLAAPAMFHVAGIAPFVSLAWLGGGIVTVPSFDAAACLDLIEKHRVTIFLPVPTMLAALVAEQRRQPRDMSTLRMLGHAGSPIALELIRQAHEVFPGSELAQFYGATETTTVVATLRHEEKTLGTELAGSVGQPSFGIAVRISRPDGTECESEEVGEILVRSYGVTAGYWNDPAATADALRGGWYHTGDLGYFNDEQYLFVVDRAKDMIVTGAENVYSVEVEDVLYRHPCVAEAAVFGVPDEKWGEAVHAIVVLHPGTMVTADELRAHCRQSIAGYKVPKGIDISTEPLPKSGPGKILKRVLRDQYLHH
ncbi:MAG TPA: AMP-binding protein [Ilumatobacteraceae bacterium]|nr:AMP-binding protein [Ilumatobacteraceae bacterium]